MVKQSLHARRVFFSGGRGIVSAGTEKKLLSFEQCVFCEKKEEATSDFFLLSVREGGREGRTCVTRHDVSRTMLLSFLVRFGLLSFEVCRVRAQKKLASL